MQSRAGGRQEHGVLTAAAEHFRLPGEWRLATFYRHAERSRPLPGRCDALRNSLGRLSLQQEGFPGQANFVLWCHASPSLFPPLQEIPRYRSSMSADLAHCFAAGDQRVGDLRDMPALKRDGPTRDYVGLR